MVDTLSLYMDSFVGGNNVFTQEYAARRRNCGIFGGMWLARIFIRSALRARSSVILWI